MAPSILASSSPPPSRERVSPNPAPAGWLEDGAALGQAGRVEAVGTTFLRLRPVLVLPMVVANSLVLRSAGLPSAQALSLTASSAALFLFFVAESFALRRAVASQGWLAFSLALTSSVLALGAACSGGLRSPLLVLCTTPVVVAFAAFGRGPVAGAFAILAGMIGGGLALLPDGTPFPPLPPRPAELMTVVAFLGSLALSFAGVAGLVSAHAKATADNHRLRLLAIEDASSRVRDTEHVAALVAHELKNPLAAVRALVQLLAQPGSEAATARRAGVALAELDRMAGIVRDYLAFNRPLSASRRERVDLARLLGDIVETLEAEATHRGVVLSLRGAVDDLTGDPARLTECMQNLILNAIEATGSGGSVVVDAVGHESEVLVRVTDTGCGLPRPVLDAAGQTPITTKPRGSGLGLLIASAVARQHGGALTFAPAEGGGTVATVRLPRARPPE